MTDHPITPFAFENTLVGVINQDGEPWFVAADVCNALSLQQATKAVERLDEDEKGVTSVHTLGGEQRLLYGVAAGQWVAPQMGFPPPPPAIIDHGRQMRLFERTLMVS